LRNSISTNLIEIKTIMEIIIIVNYLGLQYFHINK
jgi:hypothetical protein